MALTFASAGQTLASGDFRGVVKLWDVAMRMERATFTTLRGPVTAVAFAPHGRMLAVAVDYAVHLWDVAAGRLVARLEGHEGEVKCLAFSPDGTRLASGSNDRTVRLWDVARFRQCKRASRERNWVDCASVGR
jgi:WD40 repeat protein